jgi:S-adenosyl-L-methionine hydrolase (adenosine-forming)
MIALITDFGYSDYYVGVVKGVIKGINPGVEIIDISHGVRSFSIGNAQYVLYSSHKYFPAGTIFYVVVDPGVGTARHGLIALDGSYTYVLPDNGIISAVDSGSLTIYHIDSEAFPGASPTFHGRDIFAPVAAGLSMGRPPGDFGHPAETAVRVPFPDYSASASEISCEIVHIDRFGNAVTSLPEDKIDFTACSRYTVISERYHFDSLSVRSYGDLFHGQNGMIQGSSGFLEMAVNRGSIAEKFGIAIGDKISIRVKH